MDEEFLREENYQLKNEITDLKNAFDLNRDILKILSGYNERLDPHFSLLMQIITRLTSVNNQAMLNNIDLLHHKNILKLEVSPPPLRISNLTTLSTSSRTNWPPRLRTTTSTASPTRVNWLCRITSTPSVANSWLPMRNASFRSRKPTSGRPSISYPFIYPGF